MLHTSAVWLLVTIFGASAAIFTKYCDAPASSIGFWRVAGAAVILLLWLLHVRRTTPLSLVPTRGAIIAGVFLGLHFATWCWALLHTTVANAALFIGLQPLITPFIARIMVHERLNRWEIIAVLLAGAGTLWIVGGQVMLDRSQLAGTLTALVSAVLCSTYYVTCRKWRAQQHILQFSVSVYVVAALTQAVTALCLDGGISVGSRRSLLAIVALILVPTVGGHTLAMYLLKHVKSQIVVLSIPTQFIISAGAASVLFAQVPSPWFYPGAALILVGVVLGIVCAEPAAPVR
jgi:drug/metabolite transporter (DMT)-like permease